MTIYMPLTVLLSALFAKVIYKNLVDTYLLLVLLPDTSRVSSLEDPLAFADAF